MTKNKNFQKRFLLNLCFNNKNTEIVRKILKSPLGLTKKIIRLLFKNNFKEVKDNLDSIKKFVAGINRSEAMGKSYSLAKFYPYLFSFHQFVHSSYRARQGKTLEELFKEVIRRAKKSFIVPDKEKEKRKIMSEVFRNYSSKLDIDVVARKTKGEVLALQLRSRDDTGGTTAKASLVEALRRVMKKNVKKNTNLFYLIGVWDKIKSNQKKITINKIYESLKPYFQRKISRKYFISNIEKGINLHKGVTLRLAYGSEEIVKNVSNWVGKDTNLDYKSMKKIIKTLERSDDLWLSYVIASLELENIELKKINNIQYLDKLLKSEKFSIPNPASHKDYLKLADELTLKIIPKWNKDSLPVATVSEKAHYIRDLILLKFIYDIS